MGLIATIHTTDIELMAELVAVTRNHGPVEIRYVDGGLELHHASTGPDAVIVPIGTTAAPAAPRPASKRKPARKKAAEATPDPCPHCGREFRIAAGRSRHIASCSKNTQAAPKPPAERLTGHDAIRARAADSI